MTGTPRPPAGGVFSSDEFLTVLNRVWCDGRGELAPVAVGPYVVRTVVADGEPVLDVPFLDFFVPVQGVLASFSGRYTPRVAVGDRPAAEHTTVDPLLVEPAPYIRWRDFESWDAVVAHWKKSERAIERESRRREKILVRDSRPARLRVRRSRSQGLRDLRRLEVEAVPERRLVRPVRRSARTSSCCGDSSMPASVA